MQLKNIVNTWYWWGMLMGFGFSFFSGKAILTGVPELAKGGFEMSIWQSWLTLPCGLYVLFTSIRAWWQSRGKPDPASNLDEEAAKAEAVLDAMYMRDHGRPPEKPKKEDKEVSSN